ncbi:MAG: hypothetical protein JSR82_19245 [Verrucomicrobia bacterium]|nr:hypothetical protein [Verrucomicrobiota bacterium]
MRTRLTALLLAALFVLPAQLLAYVQHCPPEEVTECALRPALECTDCERETCPRGPQSGERGCAACVITLQLFLPAGAFALPGRSSARGALDLRDESAAARAEAPPQPPPKV